MERIADRWFSNDKEKFAIWNILIQKFIKKCRHLACLVIQKRTLSFEIPFEQKSKYVLETETNDSSVVQSPCLMLCSGEHST